MGGFCYTFYPCGDLRRYRSEGRMPAQAHALLSRVACGSPGSRANLASLYSLSVVPSLDENLCGIALYPGGGDAGGGRGRQGQTRRGVLGDERSCRFAAVTQRVARLLGDGWEHVNAAPAASQHQIRTNPYLVQHRCGGWGDKPPGGAVSETVMPLS